MTTDHLGPVLDNIRDTHLLHQMGEQLATARIAPGIHGRNPAPELPSAT